tara:strand:- start:52 stop:303 length:252 start_codon:yes stop_codon:yes gene_type:complete
MSKKDELTKKQKEELQRLVDELMDLSTDVVDDYEETPSELSGSVTQINENSPFLDTVFEGDKWKRVIKNIPEFPEIEEDNDTK